MTKKVGTKYNLSVVIGPDKSNLHNAKQLLVKDKNSLEKLWNLSTWRVVRHNADWVIMFDYLQEPYIQENLPRKFAVSISNVSGHKETYRVTVDGLPEKWKVSGLPEDTFGMEKDGKKTFELSILANAISSDTIRLSLMLVRGADSDSIPFTLFKKKH